jgi:hypothetical protein
VDFSQSDYFVDRQFMCFAFQTVKPAGRDLAGEIASLPGEAETMFLNLSQ